MTTQDCCPPRLLAGRLAPLVFASSAGVVSESPCTFHVRSSSEGQSRVGGDGGELVPLLAEEADRDDKLELCFHDGKPRDVFTRRPFLFAIVYTQLYNP